GAEQLLPVDREGRQARDDGGDAAEREREAAPAQPVSRDRCGAAHASTRRMTALSASATMTRARKVSRIELASPPLSIFIDWSISWRSPPPPPKPITTDARTAHSQRQ